MMGRFLKLQVTDSAICASCQLRKDNPADIVANFENFDVLHVPFYRGDTLCQIKVFLKPNV